jgi:hypothetical protein
LCYKDCRKRENKLLLYFISFHFISWISIRGEWLHAGHVPGGTSSITNGGEEGKKFFEMKNFITTTGYKCK